MARKGADDGPSTPGWMVTFSDCMTLLLCFFVMLVSFSSFDEAARSRMGGAFRYKTFDSIFHKETVKDSVIEADPRLVDFTDRGSTARTDAPPRMVRKPKLYRVVGEMEAYSDRRTLHVPSDLFFYPNTASWRQDAHKTSLKLVADFLKLLPCDVVIGESRAARGGRAAELGVQRAWAVVQYLTADMGLPMERFRVRCSDSGASGGRFDGQPVMEITLLKPGLASP
jgi:chemotaxis protein MotB